LGCSYFVVFFDGEKTVAQPSSQGFLGCCIAKSSEARCTAQNIADKGLSYKGEISPFGRDDKKRTLAKG
jgi:hypothetical protein